MKQITVRYPDHVGEVEALRYLPELFNFNVHDYTKLEPVGVKGAAIIEFMNGVKGKFYLNKTGYVFELDATSMNGEEGEVK